MPTTPWSSRRAPALAAAALVATTIATPTATAQTEPPQLTAPNAVYLELGGNAIIYSVNYDRRFTNTWGGRVGFMTVSVTGNDVNTGNPVELSVVLLPVMANALIGRGTHRLELGLGPVLVVGAGEVEDLELGEVDKFSGAGIGGVTGTFGYRRQPLNGGFVFRAGLVPVFTDEAALWGGISFGWSF